MQELLWLLLHGEKINLKISWEFLVQLKFLQMQLKQMSTLILEEEGAVSTGSSGISTAGASMPVSTVGKMEESEDEQSKRTKLQQEQERLGHEATVRLQEELDEEERQRMARVHEAAHSFLLRNNGKKLEQELKLTKSYLRDYKQRKGTSTKRSAKEELDEQSSKKQKTNELSQEELQQLMIIVPVERMDVKDLQTKYPIIDWEIYTEDPRMFNSIKPTKDEEIELLVELKRLFEPDADDELWKSQKHVHDITCRLYDTCGVHHVSIKDGVDIYMMVEREYPLSRGVLIHMFGAKLLVEQDNEMCRELLRKIFLQVERPRR
ncbi:hypothetical protein Tco_0256957 [Tanacetum coccineum]